MKKEHIILILIILIGFILRLKGLIANPPFWHDEAALGWNVLNKNYSDLFEKLRFLQIAPPLFLICTKFLVFITDSYNHVFRCDMVLRFIPFICGNLSLIMFYFIGNKIFNSKWASLAGTALLALNPVLINYSYEFKPYSVDVFCSLIALYIMLNINFKNANTKLMLIYGTILAILPWFSFGCSFIIIAGFMTLSFKRDNPNLFTTLLMPVVVSAFIYLKCFVINSYLSNASGMLSFWQTEFVSKDLSNLAQLNTQNLQYFFSNIPHLSLLLVVLCLITGFILTIKDSKLSFALISILTFSTLTVASMMKLYPYSRRMILFLIPFLIIYIVKILDIKKWIIGCVVISFILIPHVLFAYNFIKIKNINKGDYSRTMMQIMDKNITPKETIVINEGSNADFFYYNTFYKIQNKIEYIKPNYTNNETNSNLMKRLPAGNYWLFMSYDYNTEFKNIQEITNWAEKNGKIIFKTQATQSILIRLILD